MRVVIIGSGNAASVLGRLFKKNGHEIIQVVSRSAEHAGLLANELKCPFTNSYIDLDKSADLYLVAISDSSLYSLDADLRLGTKRVFHTAGSVPKDVLKDISVNYGVLYPLQSLRKEMNYPVDIPFLVDGNTEETVALIENFAKSISGKVTRSSDEERLKLHVSAVVVSNFTNHLYALAEEFCKNENIDFKLLVPLIKETAGRMENYSPADVKTGPAARNDIFTLDKHLRLLTNHPELKYIYLKLTDSIMKG